MDHSSEGPEDQGNVPQSPSEEGRRSPPRDQPSLQQVSWYIDMDIPGPDAQFAEFFADEDQVDDFFDAQEEAEADESHDIDEFGDVEWLPGEADEEDDEEEDEEEEEEDEDDEDDEDDDEDETGLPNGAGVLLRLIAGRGVEGGQIVHLLRHPGMRSLLLRSHGHTDSEFGDLLRHRDQPPKDPNRFPKVPSEAGMKLMQSGVFGTNAIEHNYNRRMNKSIQRRLLERELGIGSYEDRVRNNDLITQSLVPVTKAEHIIHYNDPVYSGQFSNDGNFFYSCGQDFKVRMYDTSSPYNWKHYKTVSYPWGQWTLTDATLSPDNRWLAYTSITSLVSIAPTDPNDTGDPYSLDLGDSAGSNNWGRGFGGIWSIRFSGNGRELVAGTNRDSIVVYDIESRRVLHHIKGHDNDVNAVCFADKFSPNVIYSGSDDTTIKIWDRRSMGDKREVGALVGHIEGLTYIDSKGDGRYILSNGKDQSMKLWDVRMAMSTAQFRELDPTRITRYSGFDYRSGRYNEEDWEVHPNDNSVVTFRGHKVLNTLIRCHFSPPNSTNSRYVYSGSRDGKVYIWNLDATLARVVDVRKATKNSRPGEPWNGFFRLQEHGRWATCVRDASWHPNAPLLVASAWNGYDLANGTCTLHSFNEGDEDEAEPRMSRSMDETLGPVPYGLPFQEDPLEEI